ncbi:MAG: hypothetical protein LC667_09780, partial [Thioalkalivibrio sp.]|nr:hypothetical protein [Thioalkalivibrio sp.]
IVVETQLGNTLFCGHVNASYLRPAEGPPAPPFVVTNQPPVVHLSPPKAVRGNKVAMAHPLREDGMPAPRDPDASAQKKIASLHKNIAWLDSPRSQRYVPKASATYCNIYAYDYAWLAGVYIPRVWWTGRALTEIAAGQVPPVRYGVSVNELNANSLYNWLAEWGDDYGWRRFASPDDAQSAANVGQAVIVCAKRKDLQRSGHITAVVPEPGAPDGVSAVRTGGVVTKPLLSQAGSVNFRYKADKFYLGNQFQAFGFWGHA